jgi:prolyl-tRNA editing enzyme YbaK/EbsC (Cys-tRNA(Pro) deacylase)
VPDAPRAAALPPSAQRVQNALASLGSTARVREMPASTRTAAEAAAACGCPEGAIVKSLIFRGAETGQGILVLTSGANRVHEKRLGRLIGEKLERADADFVRAATGYAIGGVPPLAHATALRVVMDRDLQAFAEIWAAAGTPAAVFPTTPAELARLTGAQVLTVT